jgi:predicted transcriptional regulator YdeE
MICMEVEDLSEIPDGMIGFTIPPHRYGRTRSKGDPYQVIHDHLKANNIESDIKALALEFYTYESPVWPDSVEVYIPLK